MKSEFEVGEIFQLGLARLKCEKLPDNSRSRCDGCIFEEECPETMYIGSCEKEFRKDRTDVIFKLVEFI